MKAINYELAFVQGYVTLIAIRRIKITLGLINSAPAQQPLVFVSRRNKINTLLVYFNRKYHVIYIEIYFEKLNVQFTRTLRT